jgi:membrane-anchored glycerophosphoryl diester phosphodiesterase (GDPDase)
MPPDPPQGPKTIGQVLDRVYRLMRTHLGSFVAIASVPAGAVFALYAVMGAVLFLSGTLLHHPGSQDPTATMWILFPAMMAWCVPFAVVYALYMAAASYAAIQADLGVKVTMRQAYGVAWRRAGSYVWLMVLRSLCIAAPIVIFWLIIAGGAMAASLGDLQGIHPGLVFVLFPAVILVYIGSIVYAIVMEMRLSLAFPASVWEDLTAMDALRRSGQLTRGAKGRIFLVALVVYAVCYILMLALYAVVMIVAFAGAAVITVGHFHPGTAVSFVALAVLVVFFCCVLFLWIAIFSAAYAAVFAVFYRDQRLRNEGWTLAALPGGAPAPLS